MSYEPFAPTHHEEAARLDAENRELRQRVRDLEQAVLSYRGSHKGVRQVLAEAGIPCYFGEGGTLTDDPEGCPRDLIDCVRDLVARTTELQLELGLGDRSKHST